MAGARRHLAAASALLGAGIPENAAGAAYYAMLYAARAALSEEDRNAKTHRGTWALFSESFVAPGRIEKDLYDAAQGARELREASDYRAGGASADEARRAVEAARRFVAAIDRLLG